MLELKSRRRRRAGRLPERRQVVADRGAVGGPAQDRRLPVHHARAEPRRGRAPASTTFTVADVPGPDPRRRAGQGPRAGLPAPRRALRGAAARARLRDPRARPRPDQRPRRDRGRARAVPRNLRRAAGQAAAGRAEQGRRARGARAGRPRPSRPGGARAAGVRDLRGGARGAARADLRAGRGGRRPTAPPGRRAEPTRIVLQPKAGRRRRLHRQRPEARTASSCAAPSPSAGCGRPTSTTTRRSATSPTGWPGSASRRSWPGSAPQPGAR